MRSIDEVMKEVDDEARKNAPTDVWLFEPHNRRGEPYVNGLVDYAPAPGSVRYIRADLVPCTTCGLIGNSSCQTIGCPDFPEECK